MSLTEAMASLVGEAIGRGLQMGKGVVTRIDTSGEFETITIAGRTMTHGIGSVSEGDTILFLYDETSAVGLVKLIPGA